MTKILGVLFIMAFSIGSGASTIQLSAGESITIGAARDDDVVCGGSGGGSLQCTQKRIFCSCELRNPSFCFASLYVIQADTVSGTVTRLREYVNIGNGCNTNKEELQKCENLKSKLTFCQKLERGGR